MMLCSYIKQDKTSTHLQKTYLQFKKIYHFCNRKWPMFANLSVVYIYIYLIFNVVLEMISFVKTITMNSLLCYL